MPADLIKDKETMKSSKIKLNKAIQNAFDAFEKSLSANKNSNTALTQSRQVKTQLDTIIIESGTSNAETLQARVDEDGVVHSTVSERLLSDFQKHMAEIARVEEEMTGQFNLVKEDIASRGINVRQPPYNLNADGATDVTAALQSIVDLVGNSGGGKVFMPKGSYVVDGYIELYDNVIIEGEEGTVLMKSRDYAYSAYMFVAGKSRGTIGYGGGAKNIGFKNITFRGIAESVNIRRSISITLNHAQNVLFENCRFIDCITNGHAIDLLGCNDVMIDKCDFIGSFCLEGREFTEAIQIDSSTPGASSKEFINYDSLPTKDVTVRRCKFLPSYREDGTVKNWAPNPVGNHGFTGGMYYTNIVFEDNEIVDGWELNDSHWRAWVHFYGLKDSKFVRNRIINTRGVNANAFGFYTSSGGRYNPDTGASETGEPLPNSNILIQDNYFEGFRNPTDSTGLIYAYGAQYNGKDYKISKFTVDNNEYVNCSSGMADGNAGRPMMQFSRFANVDVTNNRCDGGRRLVTATFGDSLAITVNTTNDIAQSAFLIRNVDTVVITSNKGRNLRRPTDILECDDVKIDGNIFSEVLQSGADDHSLKLRNIQTGMIQGNIITAASGQSIPFGIYLYTSASLGASRNVHLLDNIITGFITRSYNTTGVIENLVVRNT